LAAFTGFSGFRRIKPEPFVAMLGAVVTEKMKPAHRCKVEGEFGTRPAVPAGRGAIIGDRTVSIYARTALRTLPSRPNCA
jgi:hypothetical protein